MVPVLTASIALRYFGNDAMVLSITTGIIAFLIIIFCEIGPKVVGATYPERIALPASLVIRPLMRITRPVVGIVNLLVKGLLRLVGIDTSKGAAEQRIGSEELRTLVLEAGNYMPTKHRSILLNLFDLENISVDDVVIPRARIEALDLLAPLESILQQLETCYHNKLPVYEGDIDRIVGVLHVRKTLSALRHRDDLDTDTLRELLAAPYFIPVGTPALRQLQYFQENRQRIGLVVNEYGEVQGLVTPEDIIEELIGEFTTTVPGFADGRSGWNADGECLVPAGSSLRELNRRLGLHLPLDGPKTLNGLILETLREIPEASISLAIDGCRMEIVQIDNQAIRTVKLFRPAPAATPSAPSR